jgi:hypothetical protein|mmetsp:Transcript_6303/g.11779  ORF Transcript_6303/g.11779 Transcript_6303/m.11779 type:complete len:126 (+) Transcript_6303:1006-1383(+)
MRAGQQSKGTKLFFFLAFADSLLHVGSKQQSCILAIPCWVHHLNSMCWSSEWGFGPPSPGQLVNSCMLYVFFESVFGVHFRCYMGASKPLARTVLFGKFEPLLQSFVVGDYVGTLDVCCAPCFAT